MRRRPTRSVFGWLMVVCVLVIALAAPGVASAAESKVVIAPVKYRGSIDDDVRLLFERNLADGLEADGLQVVRNYGAVCEDRDCFQTLAADDSAGYVVAMSVSVRERVYQLTLELVDAEGNEISQQTDECEICGPGEAAGRILALARRVREDVEAAVMGQPWLSVTSTPSGAQVFVDRAFVGTTPLDMTVAPGSHEVRVGGDGLVAQAREALFVDGKRETFTFTLNEIDGSESAGSSHKPHRPLVISGAVTFGVGVAVLGAGIPLIIIDGQENKQRCTGEDVDDSGRCRFSYETMPLGIGLAAGGGALAIVGAALLGVGLTRKKKSKASEKAQATLLISPTELGVRVRF